MATQSKEFYYLDVSTNFKINGIIPWVDLSSSSILPPHSWSAFSLCGPDNNTLVMFGGDFGITNPTNLVFTYNLKTLQWSNPTTTGYLPTPRGHHSSVLNGRIIVYGGYIDRGTLVPVLDDLVVLDTGGTVFTWSQANVSTLSPPSRCYHSATLVDHYMIVIFGRNNLYLPSPTMNEVYILDTSDKFDYKWVIEYKPDGSVTTMDPAQTTTTNTNVDTNIALIASTAVLAFLFVLAIGLLIFFSYKRKRNILLIPGSEK
ncbi:15432_t:CDS:2 [Racocetra fulgida]|uniref:15432_t:CDS:1 n=1 Tax=Racocetra fulgida TaxID=60492 RepID=A0A9N9AJY0_9GLOM|nr:15432_t:CDS:2 [Racocetra fulgida]